MHDVAGSNKRYRVLALLLAALGYNGLVYLQAKRAAEFYCKPLLNGGCKSTYTDSSDVNLDIVPRNVPHFIQGDIQDLSMFEDKKFGAVFASHVIEHVEDPDAALAEINRVSETVFVITPLPIWPWTWLQRDHIWIMWGTKKLCRNPFH